MNQLILPMVAEDLPSIIVTADSPYETALNIGISHVVMVEVGQWLVAMLPVYDAMFGHDPDEPMLELRKFINTLAGLWQLRVLTNNGDLYMTRLIEKLLPPPAEFDPIELALVVNERLPSGIYGLLPEAITNNSSSLISSRYNWYTMPNNNLHAVTCAPHYTDTDMFMYSCIQLLANLCRRITAMLPMVSAMVKREIIITQLKTIAKDVDDNTASKFGPMTKFAEEIKRSFKVQDSRTRKEKIKSLNLRVI